jgi:hypothetical protein
MQWECDDDDDTFGSLTVLEEWDACRYGIVTRRKCIIS